VPPPRPPHTPTLATHKCKCIQNCCSLHSCSAERRGERRNPFLPYDSDMWVTHLSPSHTLLLNKFNLVAHHVLVVTRAFESQEDPLNERDLEAALTVMQVRGRTHALSTIACTHDCMGHAGLALDTRTCSKKRKKGCDLACSSTLSSCYTVETCITAHCSSQPSHPSTLLPAHPVHAS
jgi:hypothetical protein